MLEKIKALGWYIQLIVFGPWVSRHCFTPVSLVFCDKRHVLINSSP